MRLVSLNAWGGTQGEVFFKYINGLAPTTDIFCFQEIFSSQQPAPEVSSGARMYLFEELEKILAQFKGVFLERSRGFDFERKVNFPIRHGLAIFAKNHLHISSDESVNIMLSPGVAADPVEGFIAGQVINIQDGEKGLSCINYHGPGLPGNKLDTPERIGLSEKLKSLWKNLPFGAKILCGDFNLYPETQSIKILESCGKNLIKQFKIENTRNEVSWNRFKNRQYFADYIFISKEINVKNFEVPYNLVSDHLPMVLDFEL